MAMTDTGDTILDDTVALSLRTEWCAEVPAELDEDVEAAILADLDAAYWAAVVQGWRERHPDARIFRVPEFNRASWRAANPGYKLLEPADGTVSDVHAVAVWSVDVEAVVAKHTKGS